MGEVEEGEGGDVVFVQQPITPCNLLPILIHRRLWEEHGFTRWCNVVLRGGECCGGIIVIVVIHIGGVGIVIGGGGSELELRFALILWRDKCCGSSIDCFKMRL